MNTKQLHYVLTLAKEKSFSAAAGKLGISQPALSGYISRLEAEIGAELFDRSQSPLKLTEKGRFFLQTATNILKEEQAFYFQSENCGDIVSGTLKIAVSPFRSVHLMPQLIKKIIAQYPDLSIQLHECVAGSLENAVIDGICDFAISVLPVDKNLFDYIEIGRENVVLAVPRKLADDMLQLQPYDINSKEIPIDTIRSIFSRIPFIVLGENQRLRTMYDAICTLVQVQAAPRIQVVNLETAYAMLNAGIGATLLPDIYVKEQELKEKIYSLPLGYNGEYRTLAAIYRKGTQLNAAARAAIASIQELEETNE